ncbi:MAG: hypothetical protein ACKVGZ_00775 [Alphaproteobacteria bacterium]|jgi:hypothetical protein
MSKWTRALYAPKADALIWRRSQLPTTSLYFLNACEDLITDKEREGAIQQIGANTFRTPYANLVIRQDLPEVIGKVLNDRARRLVYLLDDNVDAYATEAGLPEGYRRRLEDRWYRCFRPLLRKADIIIGASDYLCAHLNQYGPTERVDPVWHSDLVDSLADKLARPGDGTTRVAFLGTGSHGSELAFIMPALARLLSEQQGIDLKLPADSVLPRVISGNDRVQLRWPVPWPTYQERMLTEHYDICLYPSLNTPFAAGRSRNKLTEQVLTGAYGLFSDSWTHAGTVAASGAGGLVPNDPDAWYEAIGAALGGLTEWRGRAAETVESIRELNNPAPLRALWQRVLGPKSGL